MEPPRRRTGRAKAVSTTLPSSALVNTKDTSQEIRIVRCDHLVLENLPMVKAIAVCVRETLPVPVDVNQLVHVGILGLCDAASKFDPEKRAVFSRYAKKRIKAAMLDWASREVRPAVQASGSRPLFDAVVRMRLRLPKN